VLTRSRDDERDHAAAEPERDGRIRAIVEAYIGVLSTLAADGVALPSGAEPLAEAFQLAEAARAQSVQRAVTAAAARVAARTPELSDLIRREQDARIEAETLQSLLINMLDDPSGSAKRQRELRDRIDVLRQARQTLIRRIESEFPAYADLVRPPVPTLEQVRKILRPREALIATFTGEDRTFVWVVRADAPVAFASAPLGNRRLREIVTRLRAALDPSVGVLEAIPAFDLDLAYQLFSQLLEPLRQTWEPAESLLVVADTPLDQLPLGLLPTHPTRVGPDTAGRFSGYRDVRWLAKSHAITTVPSLGTLVTLRNMRAAGGGRKAFVGFGDPHFSVDQARAAASTRRDTQAGPEPRVAFRSVSVSPGEEVNTRALGDLPRLPDTADEIRTLATVTGADRENDVFLGSAASERTVKSLDLTRYRVVAFATHGLVPGELDGLSEPALALSAPAVPSPEDDGLLTMTEIMGLRLDADLIVLSACNTASGGGTGGEAVSGLGRAFFYAGARALLVTHWPVETTSARALTTDLLTRHAAARSLTRARALQDTLKWMIDKAALRDPQTGAVLFTYAHPVFWAPFALVGDGG